MWFVLDILLLWRIYVLLFSSGHRQVNLYPRWISNYTGDKIFEAKFDCFQQDANISLLDVKTNGWTENLFSITIQNCNELILDLEWKWTDPFLKNFKYLNIVNISQLIIRPARTICLPQYVMLRNVYMDYLKFSQVSGVCALFTHAYHPDNFKSLELKNVTIKRKDRDVVPYTNLKILVMDKVNIESAGFKNFVLHNESGSVKITNSTFKNVAPYFLEITAFEVTFSGNIMENFSSEHLILDFKAAKVNISHNRLKMLSKEIAAIKSNNIAITHNIFERAKENMFEKMAPLGPDSNSTLDFSNNAVYFFEPELCIRGKSRDNSDNLLFSYVTIFNNSVNCVCENKLWFETLAWNRRVTLHGSNFAYQWTRKANRNKCLNIPNCYISQVLKNYHDLCEKNYKCPKEY